MLTNAYVYHDNNKAVQVARDYAAFHSTREFAIISGELELGSCNSSSPLCD